MTITSIDQLVSALGNNSSRVLIAKTNRAGHQPGTFVSHWGAAGQPAPGTNPTAAERCTHLTVGAMPFAQQVAPTTSYLAWAAVGSNLANIIVDIHDRLMHMGGLVGNVTTAQTVGLDLDANIGLDNLAARIGAANYSDVSWWLEWYTSAGSTTVTFTVNVTYNDGTSGNIPISTPGNRPIGFMLNLNALVPLADTGKFIRSVNTVTLSATTGTAGNFGVTATRSLAFLPIFQASIGGAHDWALLGMPQVHNSACLFMVQIPAATGNTAAISGQLKIAHG